MENRVVEAPEQGQRRPSLLHFCMSQAARHLLDFAGKLHLLPLELAEIFLADYLGRGDNPWLVELETMSEAFWSPKRLCLTSVDGLNSRGLHYLSYYASNLFKLDLSGCSWIDSLTFLPELVQLHCLGLKDCWRLTGDALVSIQQLPKLECLDLENVYSITDDLAAHFIQGMTSLQALNVSGTGIADGFVEALTYGCRLQSWYDSRRTGGARRGLILAGHPTSEGHEPYTRNYWSDSQELLLQQWPPLHIKYLRIQRTMVTPAAISQLLALKDIMLLDVQTLNVTRASLVPFQAKYSLVTLPNNFRLLAKTNSLLFASLGDSCGCQATRELGVAWPHQNKEKLDWITHFEHRGFIQLLREASRVQSRGVN